MGGKTFCAFKCFHFVFQLVDNFRASNFSVCQNKPVIRHAVMCFFKCVHCANGEVSQVQGSEVGDFFQHHCLVTELHLQKCCNSMSSSSETKVLFFSLCPPKHPTHPCNYTCLSEHLTAHILNCHNSTICDKLWNESLPFTAVRK